MWVSINPSKINRETLHNCDNIRMFARSLPTFRIQPSWSHITLTMSYTVFLGNLPVWVTADDIGSWLAADNLVADSIKVIRNPETQESKGFAFIEAPNQEEMDTIIRRFNHAPLEDRMLRANPAQPPKGRVGVPGARPMMGPGPQQGAGAPPPMGEDRRRFAASRPPIRDNNNRDGAAAAARRPRTGGRNDGSPSAFAEELAKAL